MASEPVLSFDRFKIDSSRGQLYSPSGPIPLTPKALSLLEYLAARPGRLIKKDELLDAVWPGVFVADGALKVCIREIRKALDGAEGNRVSRKIFVRRLRDHFSPPEARRQLQTALDWARYGEVFDFDPDSEEFVLAPRD